MIKKAVFNVYHKTGEVDNIIDSLAFVIHSEQVDFKRNYIEIDERYLKGGGKIIAIPVVTHRSETREKYPTIEEIKVTGNRVEWKYARSNGVSSSTIPVIHVFKATGV